MADFDLTLRLHVRRQLLWSAGNVRPKHQLVEQNFTKPSLNCIHNGLIDEIVCMPRVCLSNRAVGTPCSCTSRIPKQHSFDPPVRRQILHMHRKFPVMFEALFRPSAQSMLLRECYCLAIPMMQNIMPRCVHVRSIPRNITKLGGPTIMRNILRKTTSGLYKSLVRIVGWPEAKRTTGVMTRSKKRSRTAKRTFLSQRICLLAKNALEAACK